MRDSLAYSYRPLDLHKNEIRLVILQAQGRGGGIECSIIHASLNLSGGEYGVIFDQTEYNALSYTWGSPDIMKNISIDGQTCPVRENLWSALYNLRLKDKCLVMWIDALCINQNDIMERNHQVAQMDIVFRYAKCVLVWLGQEGVEDAHALRSLKKIIQDPDGHYAIGGHS
jgi:hypothetical protein